jgi:hypothetical protein
MTEELIIPGKDSEENNISNLGDLSLPPLPTYEDILNKPEYSTETTQISPTQELPIEQKTEVIPEVTNTMSTENTTPPVENISTVSTTPTV